MALSVALLTAAFDNGNTDTYTTASFAPTDGRLAMAWVQAADDAPTGISLSGGGVTTWTQIGSDLVTGSGNNTRRGALFRARQDTYGSAAAVTISIGGGNASACSWLFFDVADINTGGTNGSAAIVQASSGSTGAGTAASDTLSSFADATNNGAFWFTHVRQATEITEDSAGGYSEIGQAYSTSPGGGVEGQWKIGEDTSGSATLDPTSDWAMMGVEIAQAAGGDATVVAVVATAAGSSPTQTPKLTLTGQASAAGSANAPVPLLAVPATVATAAGSSPAQSILGGRTPPYIDITVVGAS